MVIPKCLEMVSAGDVIAAVEQYLNWDAFAWRPIYAYSAQPFSSR
jgi:hypothetical protein